MRFASLVLLLPLSHFWVTPVEASFFHFGSTTSSSEAALSCGPSYSPCPANLPCCNNGTCHKTTLRACSIALGCQSAFSHPVETADNSNSENQPLAINSCFPLPVCRSFKEKFKSDKADKHGRHQALISKHAFSGDPDQAHWTSDFDHIVNNHAYVDAKNKRLVLKAKRDMVKTKSGGGFGATVSSTRWNRYGTFATQLRAASTGEGIVTAFMLSNPALGEEISFQITGRDPHTVLTEYYKHPMPEERQQQSWSVGGQKREGKGTWMTTSVPALHWPSMPSGISLESITTRGRKFKDMLLHKTSDNNNNGRVDQSNNPDTVKRLEDVTYEADEVYPSLEKSHYLKKSTTENDLVYKIEWTPKKIEWTVNGQILRTLRPEDLPLHRHTRQKLQIPSQPMQIQITVWDAGHSPDTTAWAGGKTNYGTENEKEYVALVDWIEIACYDNKEAKRNPWPGKDALARLAQAEEEERKAEAEQEALRKTKNSEDKNTLKATEDSIKEATKVSTGWLSFLSSRKSSESDQAEPKNKKQLKKEAKQQKEEARQQKKEAKQQKKQAEKEKKQKQEKARAARKPGAISMFMDRLIRVLLRWNFIVLFLVAIGSYLTEPINDHQSRLKAHKEKLGMQQ